jgi:carbonic anhydrase
MTAIDEVLTANQAATDPAAEARPGPPARHLAIVTCMDARLDLPRWFGIAIGDAHVIRNAGGIPTEDVLRSLTISQRALGTREIAVVHHTKCGMDGFDDEEFRAGLASETGSTPPWRVPGFARDLLDEARASARVVRDCPFLPHRDQVRGFVLDVATGALTEA